MSILESVTKWKDEGVRIVGIEGYSGAGKTTLANHVAKQLAGVKVFSVDDFTPAVDLEEFIVNKEPNKILDQYVKNQGIDELTRAVEQATDAQLIIIEGPFLLHKESLAHLIERLVYIDADYTVADARRSSREDPRVPTLEAKKFADYFRKAYVYYLERYHAREDANLVVTTQDCLV